MKEQFFYLNKIYTMKHKIKTFATVGLEWFEITVEADSSRSLPTIEIIGLPDAAIKESKERIRATFRHVGIFMPPRKIILNLAPSDIKKIWTVFDLPMAVAVLALISEEELAFQDLLARSLFFWELSLDGSVKRVNGLLPAVLSALKQWYTSFFVPLDNIYELEYLPNITLYPLEHFWQIISLFIHGEKMQPFVPTKTVDALCASQIFEVDFSYIRGQIVAKRALCVAAAGLHNILMVGAPWSGKTLLSKALQSILPPLGFEDIMDVSQIYSLVGKLNKDVPLITKRPFRQVHHTASKVSIIWWWAHLTPGEVSLAHKWVLFFDELTEFPREVLEVLRQPLEDKTIHISRAAGTVQYPAHVMFVSSMNPCKCWFYKDPEKACSCSHHDIKKYQSKISWPLLDRIDMMLEIPREKIDTLLDVQVAWESSEDLRKKVLQAWQMQQKRFAGLGITANSQMHPKLLEKLVPLDRQSKEFLSQAAQRFTLSPRVIHRMIKLARTIGDMSGKEHIWVPELAEAMQYRSKSMFVEE